MAAEKKKMEEEQASLRASMTAIEKQRASMGSSGSPTNASAAATGTGTTPLQIVNENPIATPAPAVYTYQQPIAAYQPQPYVAPSSPTHGAITGMANLSVSPAPAANPYGGYPPPPPVTYAPPPTSLPPDWTEHTAPNGQLYYYNAQTQGMWNMREMQNVVSPPAVC